MKTIVNKSKIHGKGLFADESIKRGDVIGVLKRTPTKRNGKYVLWVNDCSFTVTCKHKYINHSDKPNAAYLDNFKVVALKNISNGDEITHDYNQP